MQHPGACLLYTSGEPYFEAVDFQENATIAQAASAYGPNALYSDSAWLAQIKRLLTASTLSLIHI